MEPFFLPGERGQRFCLYHPPQGVTRGAIIYVHPFAEEMNKSRRMAALQSRAMAQAGFAVLQIDLLGCGDSAGNFSDATWLAWQEDVLLAYRWLRFKTPAPLTLWGLRSGCLVAANAAVNVPETVNFIFWQPVVSGKQHWQQFMRLKVASEIASGQAKGIAEQLKHDLADGKTVEIAGYTVSSCMADGLEKAELLPPPICAGNVSWIEISMREVATISPSSNKCIEQWRNAGFKLVSSLVRGPGFWQTAEIDDAPELLRATIEALETWQ